MRNAILAMILASALVTGELHAATPKTPPADVGPGRIAWFDITTPRSRRWPPPNEDFRLASARATDAACGQPVDVSPRPACDAVAPTGTHFPQHGLYQVPSGSEVAERSISLPAR